MSANRTPPIAANPGSRPAATSPPAETDILTYTQGHPRRSASKPWKDRHRSRDRDERRNDAECEQPHPDEHGVAREPRRNERDSCESSR